MRRADTRKVNESNQIASDSCPTSKPPREWKWPSCVATPARTANMIAPSGNVPYDAANESEFAAAS